MQEQPEKKRNLFSIIVAICLVVGLVVGVVIWRNWEAKHKGELMSTVLTTRPPSTPPDTSSEPVKTADPLPSDPKVLLTMAADALKDEGYFDEKSAAVSSDKGFHVYFLIKKALECGCDCEKAGDLCKNLKTRSKESNYGNWHVSNDLFTELDEKIKVAKETKGQTEI